jgi:hypothetical protein
MGLYDSFHADLTCPNCGCQASVEAQTRDFENAMLTFSIGERVELLAQADFRGLAGCRWCEAEDKRAVEKTLRQLEQALGMMGGDT